jgi:outer membrane protein
MKYLNSLCYLLVLTIFFGVNSANAALDLNEVIVKAKEFSPTLQTANQQVLNSQEFLAQSKGLVIPRLTFNANRLWQDYVSPFAPSRIQTNYTLGLEQQLFNGYREYQGINLYSEAVEREKLLLSSAEITVTESIINSFYTIQILEQNQVNLEEQKKILNSRLKELGQREKIGRSRSSETIMARTQLMNAEITIQTTERQIDSEWLNLTKISGVKKSELKFVPVTINKLEEYSFYQRRIDNHPTLKAIDKSIEIAQRQINIERSDHFPKISFRGNYYLDREGYPNNDLNWDMALTISLPIFEGGVSQSQVRQAVIQKIQRQSVKNKQRSILIQKSQLSIKCLSKILFA